MEEIVHHLETELVTTEEQLQNEKRKKNKAN
ncbi:cassette chromosome recombinase B1 [Enterococcus faecalis D6]|nr:cassette chromosome recombinase B1 [Enterococcus faecalis D6]